MSDLKVDGGHLEVQMSNNDLLSMESKDVKKLDMNMVQQLVEIVDVDGWIL